MISPALWRNLNNKASRDRHALAGVWTSDLLFRRRALYQRAIRTAYFCCLFRNSTVPSYKFWNHTHTCRKHWFNCIGLINNHLVTQSLLACLLVKHFIFLPGFFFLVMSANPGLFTQRACRVLNIFACPCTNTFRNDGQPDLHDLRVYIVCTLKCDISIPYLWLEFFCDSFSAIVVLVSHTSISLF